MHVTSDYYRNRDRKLSEMGLVDRWQHSVRNAARAVEANADEKPLRPSNRTLRGLARCHQQAHIQRIA